MNANEMINRYVHQVGEHLPRRSREDIQLELRSLLSDELEARAADTGKEPTTQMAADILREYGKPEQIALRYRPDQYLIGPRMFPFYRSVVLIIALAVTIAFTVSFVITVASQGIGDLVNILPEFVAGYFQALASGLVIFTLIAAAIERFADFKLPGEESEDWDPYSLAPVEDKQRIEAPALVAGIVWNLILIGVFNFFPHWIVAFGTVEGRGGVIPLLAPEFSTFIPWLTAYWILSILLKLYLLRAGRWQRATRVAELALGLFSLLITYMIVTNGPITTFSWLDLFVRFGLWIGIIIGSIEAVVRLVRIVFFRPGGASDDVPALKALV